MEWLVILERFKTGLLSDFSMCISSCLGSFLHCAFLATLPLFVVCSAASLSCNFPELRLVCLILNLVWFLDRSSMRARGGPWGSWRSAWLLWWGTPVSLTALALPGSDSLVVSARSPSGEMIRKASLHLLEDLVPA